MLDTIEYILLLLSKTNNAVTKWDRRWSAHSIVLCISNQPNCRFQVSDTHDIGTIVFCPTLVCRWCFHVYWVPCMDLLICNLIVNRWLLLLNVFQIVTMPHWSPVRMSYGYRLHALIRKSRVYIYKIWSASPYMQCRDTEDHIMKTPYYAFVVSVLK